MNNTISNLIELGNKYNFKVEVNETGANLIALNTDNKEVKWIKYNSEKDTVSLLGNTDNCNLWFCETRKDLTPDILIQFVSDLNTALSLPDDGRYLLKEIIDPEDWQIIAGIDDAYSDIRYKTR
jgi:hypothetical protein